MGKRDNDVVRAASEHVFALFRDAARDRGLVYHSYDRSRELARACREIAKGCELDDEQTRVVLLAAWFHDAGYAAADGDGAASAVVARRYFAGSGERPELADAVEACMRAVRSGVLENAAQEVLHDALLVPAAEKGYLRDLPLLRLEQERRGASVSDVEWTEQFIRYVEEHPFRTRYAQLEYNRGRAENLVRLHDLLREQREEAAQRREEGAKAIKGLGKTIEGVYSQMSKDLLQLLSIADRRTNTMVHVNAIMISLIAALLLRNMDSHRQLLVPTLLLLAVNLIVVVISILSLRIPRSHEPVLGAEAKDHDMNLLWIMSPVPMSRDGYGERLETLARDSDAMRKQMIDATYYARRLLRWRADLLRLTYDVFLAGLVVSVVAFAIAVLR